MRISRGVPLLLGLLMSASSLEAAPSSGAPPEPARGLSTPQLIERAVSRGRIGRGRADLLLAYALARPGALPEEYTGDQPWDGTLPLLGLRQRLIGSRTAEEERAAQVLAASASTSCSEDISGAPANERLSTHFYIQYGSITAGLTIDEYEAALETSWTTEVTAFGWAEPPVKTSNPPPGNRYHVRVDALSPGLYGFVSPSGTHAGLVGNNPATTWNDVDAYASCMVLNRDYGPPFPGTPLQALQATAAHEFNHSIQFGLGAITGTNAPDSSFIEGGATWMEDEVFDSSDDNHNYLWPDFTRSMGQYASSSPYPYWVVFRALTERFGTGSAGGGEDVMQRFWESTSQSATSNMLPALNDSLVAESTNLADAYHAAAIALKFNKACAGGYVLPHCLEEGPAYVAAAGATTVDGTVASVGGSATGSVRDNYALSWVQLPVGAVYDVTLTNTSGSGGQLRGSVACDTGTALSVVPLSPVLGPGASATTVGLDTSACVSAVLVITNQSQTSPNPSSSTARGYSVSTGPLLAVTPAGTGTGTITSSPAGIDCGATCAMTFPPGTEVTLTATADAASSDFAGWSGDCSGLGSCVVTMSAPRNVTATFSLKPRSLDVAVAAGNGTITGGDGGIDCPGDCTESFDHGAQVVLTANPDPAFDMGSWGDDCASAGSSETCVLTVDSDKNVSVSFVSDVTPPGLTSVAVSSAPFTLQPNLGVAWGASDGQEYEVRYREARYNAGFGPPAPWMTTTATGGTFPGAPGSTDCFSARATDEAGNLQPAFGAEACTAIPLDDRSLDRSRGWSRKTGSGHYLGTFMKTTRQGAFMRIRNVQALRLAIIVTKCRRCGTIKVYFRKQLLRKIRLRSSSTRKQRLLSLATFPEVRSGTVRIKVVSADGRVVKIDGLGASYV